MTPQRLEILKGLQAGPADIPNVRDAAALMRVHLIELADDHSFALTRAGKVFIEDYIERTD